MDGVFRRRKLPHWDVEGKPIFITACLDGSISSAGLRKIRLYREQLENRSCPENLSASEWELKKDKLAFKQVDNLLDHRCPIRHLEDPKQAEVVVNAFLHFAGDRYALFAFVVMPSHHHWLFLPKPEWIEQNAKRLEKHTPREVISQSIQSYTANCCNKLRKTRIGSMKRSTIGSEMKQSCYA